MPCRHIDGVGFISMHSLTSPVDRGDWSVSRSGYFTLRERVPSINWTWGYVGARDILDAVVKRKIPSCHWESKSRTLIILPVLNFSIYQSHYLKPQGIIPSKFLLSPRTILSMFQGINIFQGSSHL